MQQTLRSPISFSGIGLHSGRPVRAVVRPAAAEHGVWFRRLDFRQGDQMIPARWDSVADTPLCTRLANAAGASVGLVEHLMAALAGCGIHNALVEVNGPEIPILDGSAAPFVRGFLTRGLRAQAAPVRVLEILRRIEASDGDALAVLEPSDRPEIAFSIDFDAPAIGQQSRRACMANGSFIRDLSDSRTFCCAGDIAAMQARGLALGGRLDNAVVVDGTQVLTPGGLRHPDEPVRHKMLDAFGDLALAGAPVIGRYTGIRAGHTVTNSLLRKVFSDLTAFRMVVCDADTMQHLPGTGLRPEEIPAVA
ncbi:UDP-3-O-(3-hydroxymyristoyl) glucosamine N-acyltransferase [Oceanicola sp. 22II-s10i]|uniref:UDP-3-O-acyl-N-acetylglucosamine deacetylase n=1 Tax=Oceanicola sp. 22II-s10i TaxID=1317116 RepID=UPI000B524F9D|nr:UDP-3-O-acyl-N-acetylglucosamine deacetylase [Oceanicola sp. 22II-s10i]OWU83955.1 UDP-3-O-(3-hydroxymyristoyl) glucosamine N-acyltransferase [Oceanicola sp. 22II-s10i]